WDCLAPTFKSGRTSVMVWGAFTEHSVCQLVVIPSDRRKAKDFVEVVYEAALEPFYHSHQHIENMLLMEDGAPVHRSNLPKLWREAVGIPKIAWQKKKQKKTQLDHCRDGLYLDTCQVDGSLVFYGIF